MWLVRAVLVLSLASPNAAHASTPLEARAVALEEDGYHAEAARLWEQLAAEADDDRQRMRAAMQAANAWRDAYAKSGDRAHHCAAEAIVARALDDDELDARAREEFEGMLAELRSAGVDCTRSTPIVDDPPAAAPGAPTPASPDGPTSAPLEGPASAPLLPPAPTDEDRGARRRTIAGGVMLALAAPAVGGLVYAALADRAIVRDFERLDAERKATGVVHPDEVARLDAEVPIVRGLAIGFGVSSAVLTGVGIALLATGRRQRPASLAFTPQAHPNLGGVVVSGRF
ncbi:MAG: hypothetical protein R3B09_02360 [Nannocystaceae bacterium]